ncbi:MAG: substrate-binding domain-containing protein [Rhodospirillaceae bacterium]|nr:substrate-binding domain-containing protein [Rhodospirillaceae bacterium]
MTRRRLSPRLAAALVALAASAVSPPAASAAELRIVSGGAAKAILAEAAAAYAAKTGAKMEVAYAPMGPLMKRLAGGEQHDIAVLTAEAMREAAAKGWVARDPIEVGRVGVGVAVLADVPSPDISTVEAFKRTLLDARSIAYIDPARGTSGRHFAAVLEKLGIAAAMKPKTVLKPGGYVAEAVAKGEAALAVHQITEILPVKGVKLVGPLPAALQKITVYQAALTSTTRDPAAAKAFLAFLRTPEMRALAVKKGYIEEK